MMNPKLQELVGLGGGGGRGMGGGRGGGGGRFVGMYWLFKCIISIYDD